MSRPELGLGYIPGVALPAIRNTSAEAPLDPSCLPGCARRERFLAGDAPSHGYLEALEAEHDAYRGFNLLTFDGETLAYGSNRGNGTPERPSSPAFVFSCAGTKRLAQQQRITEGLRRSASSRRLSALGTASRALKRPNPRRGRGPKRRRARAGGGGSPTATCFV